MKMKYLFLACGMAALFAACQNENEPKAVSDKPGTSGDYRIIIEGEETDAQTSRSSGTIQFVGGTASGAGLYDGVGRAFVSATPDPGYEINYFYGGPDSEPKKYDNANGGATSFDVPINGQDHLFHVGFKKKTGSLRINAGTGGTVSPNGQVAIQREVPFSIKATPNSGYEFAGWTVNSGNVTIANASSTSTTATLNSSSGTITAQFKETTSKHVVVIEYFYWDESINDYKILTPPNYLYFYDIKTMTKIQGGAYAKGTEIAGDLTTEEISSGDSPTGNRMIFEYCTVNGARSTAHIGFTVQTTTFVYVYFRDAL